MPSNRSNNAGAVAILDELRLGQGEPNFTLTVPPSAGNILQISYLPSAGQPYGGIEIGLTANSTADFAVVQTGTSSCKVFFAGLECFDCDTDGNTVTLGGDVILHLNTHGLFDPSGFRILGPQQAPIPDCNAASVVATVNLLLAALRSHGLIAT